MLQESFNPHTRDRVFPITISIAENHYAIQAIRWNPINNHVNQVSTEELSEILQKLFRDSRFHAVNMEKPLTKQTMTENQTPSISILTAKGPQLLQTDEILYCIASSNYTWIHTRTKGRHLVSKPIKHFEQILAAPQFFRIHNSYLVNMNRVSTYSLGNTCVLFMEDGNKLEVSKRKKTAFRKLIRHTPSTMPLLQ